MNTTSVNFTLPNEFEDYMEPLLGPEEDDGGGSHELGFIESSILKMIPKFFKALVTLLICGLLLGMTFLLITLWKRGCRNRNKLKEEAKAKNGNAGAPLHSVIVTPPTEDTESSRPDAIPSSSSLQPVRAKYMKVPVPKQALLRRASGPFGSEALSFVGEQYTMKTIEKERHHYVEGHNPGHHHDRHSPHQHYHSSASSAGGGSAQIQQELEEEAYNETRTKWNCFKGNKE